MQEHHLRQELNDEVHGRPGLNVKAPSRITHLACTIKQDDPDPLEHVKKLCDALGLKPPKDGVPHHAVEFNGGTLKYERHGEFYRLSIIASGSASKGEAIALLPLGWLDNLPGERLVAIHTHILEKSAKAPTAASLRSIFGHEQLASSATNQSLAHVWTDFRIGSDGFTRMIVHDLGLSNMRLGRLVRRLHEIETYRMMALLAYPLARDLQRELGPLEAAVSATINGILRAKSADEDTQLLTQLSAVSRDIESLSSRSSYRFAAARAYTALVNKRFAELNEERVLSYQRLEVFLERRFSPAMATCSAVSDRIADLANRCERASNLLRTRVDIALEGQNQKLLVSMEAHARQQFLLQQTVEGLSVVAISYYAISIIGLIVKHSGKWLPGIDSALLNLIGIPVVILAVWWLVRRMRRRIHRATTLQN